ncbi:MAG: CDP-diacylglycerol--glycerol-3-phosphate 3-phosphatidyltransferase [Eubacterium sp.]
MNLPNKLTILRVIAVPFFIVCYLKGFFAAALIIFCLASLTDMLDGKIARARNLVTNFGKIMDPLADKVLCYSAFCLMIGDRTMPAWMLIVILAREFTIAGMRTVAASEGHVIAAAMSGKIKTVLQMFAIIFLILMQALTKFSFYPQVRILAYVLLYASLVMTVYSGIEYVVKNINVFKESN